MRHPPFSTDYSRLYDVIYAEKDYRREATYVHDLIRRFNPRATRVLEIGAGTGSHARYLSRWYTVVGYERSAGMISAAKEKLRGLPVELVQADVASVTSFGTDYGACVSLFHVLNYLPRETLPRVLRRMAQSLKDGGVLICDSWNGAAVLGTGPKRRTRRYMHGTERVVRSVIPHLDWMTNTCELTITLEVQRRGKPAERTSERHVIHYYMPAELKALLADAGFKVELLTDDVGGKLTRQAWSMQIVASKVSAG